MMKTIAILTLSSLFASATAGATELTTVESTSAQPQAPIEECTISSQQLGALSLLGADLHAGSIQRLASGECAVTIIFPHSSDQPEEIATRAHMARPPNKRRSTVVWPALIGF